MIVEIAHGLAWLALGCAVLQAASLSPRLGGLGVAAALAQGWLWLWVAGGLLWSFWIADLSVAAVADNVHSGLPRDLRLAAAVLREGGGWPVVAAFTAWVAAGAALGGLSRRVLAGLGAVAVAVQVAVLAGVQPFERLTPAPTEGRGMDPVWRDRLAGAGSGTGVPMRVGERRGGVTLVAVTPLAGPDWTAVAAEVRLGDGTVLLPQWRTTILPRHSSAIPDSGGGWRVTLGAPLPDGRWPVRAER